MRGAMAKVGDVEASAKLKQAQSMKTLAEIGMDAQGQPQQQEPFAAEQAAANVEKTLAGAAHSRASAHKAAVEADLAPYQAAHNAAMDRQNFQQGVIDREADRKIAARKPVAA